MTLINEFMIGLAAGVSVGAGLGFYFVQRSRTDQRFERLENFRYKRDTILKDIVFRTGSVNALILKIHNGGSKLTEGTPWYSSVVAEAPTFYDVSAIEFWQNKSVDEQYKGMIRQLQKDKMIWMHIDGPKIGPTLQRVYSRMAIIGTLVVELYRDDHYYYYASFPVREDFEKLLENGEINKYEVGQTHLKRLYHKYHNLGVLEMDWLFPTATNR